MSKGIDISKWQGNIDWNVLASSKCVDFVIIRAGVSLDKDTKFEANYAGCKKYKIPCGVYFYSYAKTIAEAEAEAKTFLKTIAGKQFEYPVYFDIEDKSQMNLPKKLLTDICIAWCDIVEKAGYYVGIYSNPDWFINRLDTSRLTMYDKWLAHWASKPMWGNEFGGMWQYSCQGKIAGISGDVDLDESYRDYPSIIRNAKLNGYGKHTVIATKYDLSDSEARELKVKCENLGMTAVVKNG